MDKIKADSISELFSKAKDRSEGMKIDCEITSIVLKKEDIQILEDGNYLGIVDVNGKLISISM